MTRWGAETGSTVPARGRRLAQRRGAANNASVKSSAAAEPGRMSHQMGAAAQATDGVVRADPLLSRDEPPMKTPCRRADPPRVLCATVVGTS